MNQINESKKDVLLYRCLDGAFNRLWVKDNCYPMKKKYQDFTKLSAWGEKRLTKKYCNEN